MTVRSKRSTAAALAILLTVELLGPLPAPALTGGPSQPEATGFEPIGTSDMVDLFSGDFVYNLPLMDMGGYPLNLSYHSGVSMDQEASWVGLGWSLNPGIINRGMRGIPDDFRCDDPSQDLYCDQITKTFNLRPNETRGANLEGTVEVVGKPAKRQRRFTPALSVGTGVFYNNYRGLGAEFSLNPSLGVATKIGFGFTANLGLNANSQQGLDVNPGLGLSYEAAFGDNQVTSLGLRAGAPYNSRAGLKALSLSSSLSQARRIEETGTRRASRQTQFSFNGGAAIPLNPQSYVPQISLPMSTVSTTVHAGLGTEVKWVNLKGKLTGYFTRQELIAKRQSQPAYGYLYLHRGQGLRHAVLDFNREKDGAFTIDTPGLPLTQLTYDSYNVSGQGISGMYRPYRGDVGRVFDGYSYIMSSAGQVGVDVGFPEIVKAGVNLGSTFNYADSGPWSGGDDGVQEVLSFKALDDPALAANPAHEPVYFKQAGEMVAVDEPFHAALSDEDPVRLRIDADGRAHPSLVRSRYFQVEEDEPLVAPLVRSRRERRNQSISVLTAEHAQHAGLVRSIESYRSLDATAGTFTVTAIPRVGGHRKPHHISEITVFRPDGARYVFGIPAYNLHQKEVTFNATGLTADCANGLVRYQPGQGDNSPENKRGMDHFYSATELPPYAHAYLLTTVLSADYVDRQGDGPTPDDLGSYTKFNYTQAHGPEAPGATAGYRWRVPVEEDHASYSEGLKADPEDDKASYLYGEKEIWELFSVETKTHVAEFTLVARDDSFGVADENGGWHPDMALRKLDKITLYSRWDRLTRGAQAVPIKTVHFRYDYSLTSGVPNHRNAAAGPDAPDTGKLTLKEVYFTYQDSRKGERSPYRFRYSAVYPPYNLKGYDRWGYYKANEATSCDVTQGPLSNSDFPYVEQDDPAKADERAAAWHLTGIELPSGGLIDVEYEADRYGFVQDRKAMQMVAVTALGRNDAFSPAEPGDLLFEKDDNRLFLRLELPAGPGTAEEVLTRSLHGADGKMIGDLYFKFLVDVTGEGGWEFVTGWAEVADWGVTSGQPWLKLRAVPLQDRDGPETHPVAKAAWQMARLYLSRLIHPGSDPGSGAVEALRGLLAAMGEIRNLVQGHNRVLRNRGLGKRIVVGKSFVRLYRPDYAKLGGGSRVKSIRLDDRFRDMLVQGAATPAEAAEAAALYQSFGYGQEYSYTAPLDPNDPESPLVSSGVASYEPFLGGEENPLRQPMAFSESHKLAPDDRFYHETPYGETLYPGPSVGYSRVTVRNLPHLGVRRNATGFVVHEFYTARDFPVTTRTTGVDARPNKPRWLLKLLKLDIQDHLTASQGYVVELNNMHGVTKAQWVYPEPGVDATGRETEQVPISGVRYIYRTDAVDEKVAAELAPFASELAGRFDNARHLNSRVVAVEKNGTVAAATVGVETDLVADMRESSSFTTASEFAANLDVSLLPLPPAPLPIPSFWPFPTREETRFRSAVLTKVVTRYGILSKTIAYDLGSRVSTENLTWDAETGEVLLTRTQNDFEDPVYSFTYPAHWGYERMGPAYRNLGLTLGGVQIAGGELLAAQPGQTELFVPGDEVLVSAGAASKLLWVSAVNHATQRIALMDRNGTPVASTGPATLTLYRSGRRNQQSTPIGTVTTLASPITSAGALAFDEVLNAGAVEFTESWGGFCECGLGAGRLQIDPAGQVIGTVWNPYVEGELGSWRALRSHLYLTERTQAQLNRNSYIRKDGTFTDFRPFWLVAGGNDWTAQPEDWQFTSEVSLFSPFGFEIENRDALDRHSAALYAFNQTLPTAVASNTRYREIAFESFEDVDCDACGGGHLSFTTRPGDLSREESHTGRRSLKVAADSRVSVLRKIRCEVPEPAAVTIPTLNPGALLLLSLLLPLLAFYINARRRRFGGERGKEGASRQGGADSQAATEEMMR